MASRCSHYVLKHFSRFGEPIVIVGLLGYFVGLHGVDHGARGLIVVIIKHKTFVESGSHIFIRMFILAEVLNGDADKRVVGDKDVGFHLSLCYQ